MKQHIVRTESHVLHFKETSNICDVNQSGMQIYGQGNNITEFVQSLDLDNQWIPYGYILRFVYRAENSKNMTAFLYKIGQKFTT